ncbi:MAG: hypothetical protein U0166_02110 [Acidobacteriota bacterium]
MKSALPPRRRAVSVASVDAPRPKQADVIRAVRIEEPRSGSKSARIPP